MSFLTLDALSKRYGAVTALDRATLALGVGTRAAIVGPSGSGKTTLLRLIAGFDVPDSGQISLDGRQLANGPDVVPAHQRDVGVVMQDGALFPHLSVSENIGFGLPRGGTQRNDRILELSDMVGLDRAMLGRKPDALSGGQQQRVALARALACRPKLMLLDEPFSALDTGLRASTRKVVGDLLRSAGITTVLVTHDQAEALSFADHVAVMDSGRILQAGAPHELYFRPATPMIAAFLGEAIILPATVADGWADCALGRVEIDNPALQGPADIMLRPEQISFTNANDGPRAKVVGVEFAGPFSIVTVKVEGSHTLAIALRRPSIDVPALGDEVGVSAHGPAHVFRPI
jgi:iron(III) transport system ATP-binding protein